MVHISCTERSYVSNSSCQQESTILSTLEILHPDYVIPDAYCSIAADTYANSTDGRLIIRFTRSSVELAFNGITEKDPGVTIPLISIYWPDY